MQVGPYSAAEPSNRRRLLISLGVIGCWMTLLTSGLMSAIGILWFGFNLSVIFRACLGSRRAWILWKICCVANGSLTVFFGVVWFEGFAFVIGLLAVFGALHLGLGWVLHLDSSVRSIFSESRTDEVAIAEASAAGGNESNSICLADAARKDAITDLSERRLT